MMAKAAAWVPPSQITYWGLNVLLATIISRITIKIKATASMRRPRPRLSHSRYAMTAQIRPSWKERSASFIQKLTLVPQTSKAW